MSYLLDYIEHSRTSSELSPYGMTIESLVTYVSANQKVFLTRPNTSWLPMFRSTQPSCYAPTSRQLGRIHGG